MPAMPIHDNANPHSGATWPRRHSAAMQLLRHHSVATPHDRNAVRRDTSQPQQQPPVIIKAGPNGPAHFHVTDYSVVYGSKATCLALLIANVTCL